VEWLTNKVEKDAFDYIRKIDELGGMLKAIEKGYPQSEIANASYHFQKQLETGEKVMVGVNKYQMDESSRAIDVLHIGKEVETRQKKRISDVKRKRDPKKLRDSLAKLKQAAKEDLNTMPIMVDCVKNFATVQEICDTLRDVYGTYREPGNF
jgi:methylmalonyl-CoA mutase N-terminal domain/subunit